MIDILRVRISFLEVEVDVNERDRRSNVHHEGLSFESEFFGCWCWCSA